MHSAPDNARFTRRDLLKGTAAAGIGYFSSSTLAAAARPESANDKLDVAFIGIGGRGGANLGGISKHANVVALCDVDDKRAGKAYDQHPKARKFYDFRKMLDAMGKSIDGVVISTPDHTHFHPAHAAFELGLHVYLEKPMAHSIWEIRTLTDLARKHKRATQLGVQRHVLGNVHRIVETIRQGVIGEVHECHAWVGGDRGMPKVPTKTLPVPSNLKWDLWLGPAKKRPYSEGFAPYDWRFWWDYGTGETGNWGCHILDLPFWALELKYPTKVDASGPPVDPERSPKSMETHFEFPARGRLSACKLHWYHTKAPIPLVKEHGLKKFNSGVLFVGSKGMLIGDFGKHVLYPEGEFKGFEGPKKTLADSPGFYKEWINACKDGEAATCNFDYSGPLAETVILGNVAYRAGGFEWNADKLEAKGNKKAQALIRSEFRSGWEFARG